MKLTSFNTIAVDSTFMTSQIAITLTIAYLISHHIINFYHITWFAFPALAFILLTKKTVSPDHQVRHVNGIKKIIIFQCLLFLTYYGISTPFSTHTLTTSFFFPWELMLLIAAGLRLFNDYYHKGHSIIDLINACLHLKEKNKYLAFIFLIIRGTANLSIGLTLSILAIGVYTALLGSLNPLSLTSLLVSLFLIILLHQKHHTLLIKKISQSRRWLYLTLPAYTLGLSLILAVLTQLLSSLSDLHTQTPYLIALFNHCITPSAINTLFQYGWWLTWSGIGGIVIAYYSQGFKLRYTILAGSIVPIVMQFIFIYGLKNNSVMQPIALLAGFIGITGIIYLLTSTELLPCMIAMQLPNTMPHKQRAHQFIIQKNIRLMLLILLLAIPIGLQIISFFSAFISVSLAEFCLAIIIAVTRLVFAHAKQH